MSNSCGNPIKMKVPVATILTAARKERDRLQKKYERDLDRFNKSWPKFRDKAIKKIDAVREQIAATESTEDADDLEWDTSYISGSYKDTKIVLHVGTRPQAPENRDVAAVERDIAILEATTAEELTLTVQDQFARYLPAS